LKRGAVRKHREKGCSAEPENKEPPDQPTHGDLQKVPEGVYLAAENKTEVKEEKMKK